MQIRPGIEIVGMSDVGCQRLNNEDAYSYWEPCGDPEFERKGRLAIIADGMGGHEGGQEASQLAVDTIQAVYSQTQPEDPQSALITALQTAHDRIREYAQRHPALHGMGTTATAVVLRRNQLFYAHVGDSRLYLVRGQHISRLTHDHSYVGRLVERGVISFAEAEAHPQRHILTAALGTEADIAPDTPEHPLPLGSGDQLVLCTDGLWSMLKDDEINKALMHSALKEACKLLIQIAKNRGGPDNITVQLMRIE